MQQPEGTINPITDFFSKEKLDKMKDIEDQLSSLRQKSVELEEKTGKPHPVFVQGEELQIRGGKFKVDKIEKDFLILKPIKY